MTRTRSIARTMVLAVAAATSAVGSAHAQADDWPCVQRLVPALEAGQMWSGPALPRVPAVPDTDTAALVRQLVDVHRASEALAADLQTFADSLPAEQRSQRLAELFALVLDQLNGERTALIGGIKRYARGQQRMAEKISAETRALDALRQEAGATPERIAELQVARDWDARVFTDRQRSLQLVCEQPVLLEQRAFALARLIQDRLP